MSTLCHLQTDSQSKLVNQTFEQYLQNYRFYQKNNCVKLLLPKTCWASGYPALGRLFCQLLDHLGTCPYPLACRKRPKRTWFPGVCATRKQISLAPKIAPGLSGPSLSLVGTGRHYETGRERDRGMRHDPITPSHFSGWLDLPIHVNVSDSSYSERVTVYEGECMNWIGNLTQIITKIGQQLAVTTSTGQHACDCQNAVYRGHNRCPNICTDLKSGVWSYWSFCDSR